MSATRFLRLTVIALVTVLIGAACGDDDDVTVDDAIEEPGIPPELEEVDIGGADQYVGEEVTVEGEVSAQVNDRTFYILNEAGDDQLLVFAQTDVVDELESTDVVRVTGEVIEVDRERYEDEFNEAWHDAVDTRHAIEATDVSVVGEVDDDTDEVG